MTPLVIARVYYMQTATFHSIHNNKNLKCV